MYDLHVQQHVCVWTSTTVPFIHTAILAIIVDTRCEYGEPPLPHTLDRLDTRLRRRSHIHLSGADVGS